MNLVSIERAWRAGWMRLIARQLPGPRTATLPPFDRHPRRVLFLRYERIGDLIMATGMMRVLAQSHPSIILDVVATPTTRTVLENNPHVHRVFTLNRKSWRDYVTLGAALRAERYDVIVDGRLNNPRVFTSTPILMLLAGARYRVGVSGGNNDLVYNVRVGPFDKDVHYVQESKSLARPFNVDVDAVDWQPEIFLSDAEIARAELVWERAESLVARAAGDSRRLLVNLSASEPKRRWPDERFVAVLSAVRARDPHLPIVVMGLPSEWSRVQSVADAVGVHAQPTPALREALALVGTSDRVFTPDTSISHAASAFRKPAVVLLKKEHAPYAPWNIPAEIVAWRGETIFELPVDDVLPAVLRLVDQR